MARARVYRSDRLSDLTPADHGVLERLGIVTVVDLRYEREAAEHPSRLWFGVENQVSIPMGGDLADQRTFIERALGGEYDGITDDEVGESYVSFLVDHAADFGTADRGHHRTVACAVPLHGGQGPHRLARNAGAAGARRRRR